MNVIKAKNLACPIDGCRLRQQDKQLICENGHSFDIAKQGYVNLLPVHHKRSKQPGDSKVMVVARTQFLDTGIYLVIAEKLSTLVADHVLQQQEICLLDAGCGEGYYFDIVLNYLRDIDGIGSASFIGLDISKDAVLQATKRNKNISWLVGTNRKPPVEDNSIDIILCLFGFLNVEGFSKALKPGGKLILVDPGGEHLKELRKIIYTEVKKTDIKSEKNEMPGFSLLSSESLKYTKTITSNEQINNLLVMTPHFYRASKTGRQEACKLASLEITIDVVFRVFEID